MYADLNAALRRYNSLHSVMATKRRTFRAEVWGAMAERLICCSLIACLRGDRLEFVAARVRDCQILGGVKPLWRPSN